MRIGIGYDSHRLVKGRKLIIGGILIPHERGLFGHSDADVLCHAIIDAILGAVGLGDIGNRFPDTDEKWKDASSIDLLKNTVDLVYANGYELSSIDSIVIAESPFLSPYIESMKERISQAGIAKGSVNIKAKTNEGMGMIGSGEGIAAFAVCLLQKTSQE